ncbi:MAG: ABC transporter substrate-binding protein [Microcoleaceae cyanobacterium]
MKILIKTVKTLFLFSLSLIFIACTAANNPTVSNTNLSDTSVERVVALSSLMADVTQKLSPEKLVGIPGSRLLKENPQFKDIETVSSGRTPPNLEKVVALQPDLVLGAAGFHDQVGQRLEEIGISTNLVEVDSWNSLKDITTDLANRLNANAEPLLQRYQSCIEKASNSEKSVLVLVSRQPILSPNKQSWAGDFLQQFNVNNLAADLQGNSQLGGYVTLSAEKLLEANPDVIFVIDPGNEGIVEQFQKDPFWGKLQAATNEQVYSFDYYGLINPGSIEKIESACASLSEILSS